MSERERLRLARAVAEAARSDPALAVLEGAHALKHALRFGAQVEAVFVADRVAASALLARLAPDLRLPPHAQELGDEGLSAIAPRAARTGVVAFARRPMPDLPGLLAGGDAPLVLLEQPRTMGNMGAAVRVAAAAGARGVATTGLHDPWHPDALRGAAGLHFALPVVRLDGLGQLDAAAPLVAMHPDGEPLRPDALPANAILAFGTEREGLSTELLERAALRLTLPMRPGVSSLNLATAVAATLYAWKLASTR